MVMMSMMAAGAQANLSREKLKKGKEEERKTLQSERSLLSLSDSLVFHSAFN